MDAAHINTLGLLPTNRTIGESFLHNVVIYQWPIDGLDGEVFIFAADDMGRPFKERGKYRILYLGKGSRLALSITEEFLLHGDGPHLVAEMIRRELKHHKLTA